MEEFGNCAVKRSGENRNYTHKNRKYLTRGGKITMFISTDDTV